MALGALVGAGAPVEALQAAVDALGVEPVRLSARAVLRAGVQATQVVVETAAAPAPRDWAAIRSLLNRASVPGAVREVSLRVFEALARAEARVHGGAVDDVHFHEVGALDSLADVVGAAAGLVSLGVADSGCAHLALGAGRAGPGGALPVPPPAVLELLREAGATVVVGGGAGELTTPTGAALLAATVSTWGASPPLAVRAISQGAGGRDPAELPNVASLVIGERSPEAAGSAWTVVEANVDDLDPRVWPGVLEALLGAGAADAWLTTITMKKGRPAHTVHALVAAGGGERVREALFRNTSTIGCRSYPVAKHELARESVSVQVSGADVTVKLARLGGRVVSATPEFAEVAALAARLGRPVKEVLAAAVAAAARAGYPEGTC